MSSGFTPSSEGVPQDTDEPQERPVDIEWRRWLDRASQEQYTEDEALDPFQYTYAQLSRMTVLCFRLFAGLRGAQERLDKVTAGRAYGVREAYLALQNDKVLKAEGILAALLEGAWDSYVPDEGEENE